MSLPIFRQENAAQVRVSIENHAHQVKRLPFMPICRAPNTGYCRNVGVLLVHQNFQTNAMIFFRREEMVVHLKARLLLDPSIDSAKIRQEIKLALS